MAVASESLHRDRSNISLGGVSLDDLAYLDEHEAVGNPSKEFTNSPEDKDLLSRFQVACIIVNRMIGMPLPFYHPVSAKIDSLNIHKEREFLNRQRIYYNKIEASGEV